MQFSYELPIFLTAVYLYMRFKHSFSESNSKNLVKVAALMIVSDTLSSSIFFMAAFKHLFEPIELLRRVFVPLAFAAVWCCILLTAYYKNGEYGAPKSLFFVQKVDA